jgi:fatty acid desaturase
MSKDEEPRDLVSLLVAFGQRVYHEMRGKHGSRARTTFSRIAVLVVVLAFGGPILWAAVWSMPTALVVVIAVLVGLWVVGWFWRRYYQR